MALLSTFKSFKKWIPVGGDWQLVSEQTHAKDIIFNEVILCQRQWELLFVKQEKTKG
jgi:hypothetical protein